jgi:hypothetical protein
MIIVTDLFDTKLQNTKGKLITNVIKTLFVYLMKKI